MAQLRVLGGSLGISVSTVLLHRAISQHVVGVLIPQDLSALGGGVSHLSPSDRAVVSAAYSEAFHTGMVSATAVSVVAVLAALGGYRRKGKGLGEKMQVPT